MRSTSKKPHNTDRAVRTIRSSKGAGDQQSLKLTKLQKKMGNSGLSGKVDGAASKRDLLLAFACERLRIMRQVQVKEHKQFAHVREWFRDVAKGKEGFNLPDPTRWHEAAKMFKAASLALCNGNVTRGAQLMEQALEHERAAFDSMPDFLQDKLEGEEQGAGSAPAELDLTGGGESAPACNLPAELVFADQILNLTDELWDLPPVMSSKHTGWWDLEEEEEDGDDKDKKGDKDGDKQAARAPAPATGGALDEEEEEEVDKEKDLGEEEEETEQLDEDGLPIVRRHRRFIDG